jgi:hypothetical protein
MALARANLHWLNSLAPPSCALVEDIADLTSDVLLEVFDSLQVRERSNGQMQLAQVVAHPVARVLTHFLVLLLLILADTMWNCCSERRCQIQSERAAIRAGPASQLASSAC